MWTIRALGFSFTAVTLSATAVFGHAGCSDPLPDVWPGAFPDDRRAEVGADAGAGMAVDVLTFNVKVGDPDDDDHPWCDRRAIVADIVREQAADVVGLQEALRSQLDDLGPPEPYRQIAIGRDDGNAAGEHAAILYRNDRFSAEEQGAFWLSPTPEVPGSAGWGNRVPRICTWTRLAERTTGRGLYVFNTHFDNASQPSRALGIELIAQRIAARATPDPVVLIGDFNATEDNAAVQYVLGRVERASTDATTAPAPPGFIDAFRAAHPTATEIGTFHRWAGTTTGRRIDFIFAPPPPAAEVLDAAILRARRGGIYPSDHFPVRARVWFPAR